MDHDPEEVFEKVIQHLLDNKQHEDALEQVNKRMRDEKLVLKLSQKCLLELRVRCIWYMSKDISVTTEAFEQLMHEGGLEFKFPLTFFIYGCFMRLKGLLDVALNFLEHGLEKVWNTRKNLELIDQFIEEITRVKERIGAREREISKKSEHKRELERGRERARQREVARQSKTKNKWGKKGMKKTILEGAEKVEEDVVLDEEEEDEENKENKITIEDADGEKAADVIKENVEAIKNENEKEEDKIAEKEEARSHLGIRAKFTRDSEFTLIAKTGHNCYRAIDSGRINVEKSLVVVPEPQIAKFNQLHALCSKHESLLTIEDVVRHSIESLDFLVSESVVGVGYFFERELQRLDGVVTRERWWHHIAQKFRTIFRDVVQGLMFLNLSTDFVCGDLAFSIFVTEDGRGRILPNLYDRTTKGLVEDVRQLKEVMHSICFLPFADKDDDSMLPLELQRLLKFDHNKCLDSHWFLINHPFMWSLEECIQFPHKLKKLMKCDILISKEIENALERLRVFVDWVDKPTGVYLQVLRYFQNKSKKKKKGNLQQKKKLLYEKKVDIVRFYVATYTHVNDMCYKKFRPKRFEENEIEDTLRRYFPTFYVDMYECICVCADYGVLNDEDLKRVVLVRPVERVLYQGF
ncbi:hypothetical protein OROGR_023786 [Orobanche gracilis]